MNKVDFRSRLLPTSKVIGRFLSIPSLIKLTRQPVILPFYHIVSDDNVPHVKHLYPVKTVEEFISDLDTLLKYYEPIDLSQLLKYGSSKQIGKPSFFLTFDDGLREFNDVIAPVLLQKGVPAAIFLNSSFVDNKDLFFRYKASVLIDFIENNISNVPHQDVSHLSKMRRYSDYKSSLLNIKYQQRHILDELASELGIDFQAYLSRRKPYLDSSQIMKLKDQGFYFGAHSLDHPLYSDLPMEDQILQTINSMDWVQNTFDLDYRIFAFPFTDDKVGHTFFEHFQGDLDATFGTAGLKMESMSTHFQRLDIPSDGYNMETRLKNEYLYYLIKGIVNKNKIQRYG